MILFFKRETTKVIKKLKMAMCVLHQGDREEPPVRRGRGRPPKQPGQSSNLSNVKKVVCTFPILYKIGYLIYECVN